MITRAGKGGMKNVHLSGVDRERICGRWLPRFLFFVALLVSLVRTLPPGIAFDGDEVSYLDIGDAYFRGDWKTALNAQWSPLYSWIEGLALHLLRPSFQWEPWVVQLVNFVLYIFTLVCFHFFWRQVIRARSEGTDLDACEHRVVLPRLAFWALGYTIFLFVHVDDLSSATPDVCFAGLVYLAAGRILSIRSKGASCFTFLVLGIVLGVGYLAKAVMLPLAVVFLAVAVLSVRNRLSALVYGLVAIVAFLAVAGPFVFALSKAKGRLTFGDTGFLNYAWHVNGAPFVHWQGDLPGLGKPAHATRKIFQSPTSTNSRLRSEAPTPHGTTPPIGTKACDPDSVSRSKSGRCS
jgi:hypothetical protein